LRRNSIRTTYFDSFECYLCFRDTFGSIPASFSFTAVIHSRRHGSTSSTNKRRSKSFWLNFFSIFRIVINNRYIPTQTLILRCVTKELVKQYNWLKRNRTWTIIRLIKQNGPHILRTFDKIFQGKANATALLAEILTWLPRRFCQILACSNRLWWDYPWDCWLEIWKPKTILGSSNTTTETSSLR